MSLVDHSTLFPSWFQLVLRCLVVNGQNFSLGRTCMSTFTRSYLTPHHLPAAVLSLLTLYILCFSQNCHQITNVCRRMYSLERQKHVHFSRCCVALMLIDSHLVVAFLADAPALRTWTAHRGVWQGDLVLKPKGNYIIHRELSSCVHASSELDRSKTPWSLQDLNIQLRTLSV